MTTDTTHITKEGLRSEFEKFCKEKCSPGANFSEWYWQIFQAGARAAELEQSQPAQISHHEDCWRDPKHHACAVAKIEQSQSAQDASPKDGYTGWLLEQEIKGVILYYRKTAFTEMPTRDATEANLFHSQYFAQQVADRLGCGWLVREHAFVGASTK